MKHLIAVAAIFTCALAFLAASPGTSLAGGGHGYKRHYGHGYYGHGYRRHHRSNYHFRFSYYGHRPYYGYGYPRYYRYPRVIYADPPISYVSPAPVYAAPPTVWQKPSQPAPQPPAGCEMTREYQTQITVGGEQVDAYGDACLKADGSWEFGAPKIVPQ